jgi:hypothetical protein
MSPPVEVVRGTTSRNTVVNLTLLILITALALAVHGFHYGIEDEAIYLPAIKKELTPSLYPSDSIFFLSQTKFTIFPALIASVVRVTSLPLASVVFVIHLLSIFLGLTACWRLSRHCFADVKAQSASVVMIASLQTLPVAGTALYIMDQHLHPRSLATDAIILGMCSLVDKHHYKAGLAFLGAMLVHPLMGAFGVALVVFLRWNFRKRLVVLSLVPLLLLPPSIELKAPSEAWREAVNGSSYYFLLQWEWYEWVGIFAPLGLLSWFGYLGRRHGLIMLEWISRRLSAFGICFFALSAMLLLSARFERVVSFQPMRFLHLVYFIFFMLAGGMIGKWFLRDRPLRWLTFFAPLCLLMFLAQRQQFPASPHIEWPCVATDNKWLNAFEWIRQNTPRDAVFALDPDYLRSPGLDYHGFRALAERGMLADRAKDRTVATLSPAIAEDWLEQVKARDGWKDFRCEDFQRLKKEFGASWVVIENKGVVHPPIGLDCQYRNEAVSVCRIEMN